MTDTAFASFFFVPTISSLCMNPSMTAAAKRHQIAPVMCTAFRKWFLMMNSFNGSDDSFLKAHLTEGVGLDVGIPDAFPGSAVPTAYSRVPVVLLVVAVVLLRMFFTETVLRQLGTTRMAAWVLWLSRHTHYLLQLKAEDVPHLLRVGNSSVWHHYLRA